MEVLMKCPATTGKTGAASTALSQPSAALKLVDHHRQLKQQQQQQHQLQKQHNGKSSATEAICCLECPPPAAHQPASLTAANSNGSQPPLACCSPATSGGAGTPPAWEQRRQVIDYSAANSLYDQSRAYSTPPPSAPSAQHTQPPPCCGGSATPPPAHMNGSLSDEYSQSYEYREPEENFVSIDDARIKGFLLQMSRQHFEAAKKKAEEKRAAAAAAAITYEVIDLDDEEERQKLKRIKERAERDLEAKKKIAARQLEETARRGGGGATCNTASISLIPRRSCAPGKERIIAQIDLLDSSSSEGEEEDDDESESRKTMANIYMVSCELQCDEDDQEERDILNGRAEGEPDDAHGEEGEEGVEYFAARRRVPLGGGKSPASERGEAEDDEEEDEEEFIDEPHPGIELSFEHKERSFFECFLCGKKVQSSYNLRRHMMIHTGERPFACDLCERRFREFSDLKKHRRRHANEPNFVCMVCRSQPPTAGDATRCSNCDTKQSAIVASSRPQASSPDASVVAAAEGQHKEAATRAIVNASTTTTAKTATTKETITPVTVTTATKLYATALKPPAAPPTTTANQEIAPTTTTTQPSKTTIKVVVATASDGCAATTTTTTVFPKPSMHRPSGTPPPTKGGKSNGLSLLRHATRSGQQALNLATSLNATTTITPLPPAPPPPPPLTPIAASHLLLDSMPAVHRPSYNQMGVVTRKEFPCPLCQRAFGTRHNLKRHFMIHTGEKPFSCHKCRKPFREYSTLKKHMVTHDRDRWYKCARCPQKYRDYLEYNEHRRSHPEGEAASLGQAMSPGAEGAESSSSSNGPSLRAKRPRRTTAASKDFIGFGEDSTDTPHEEYDDDDDEEEMHGGKEQNAEAGEQQHVDISMEWLECCECGRRFIDLDVYTEHLKHHAAVNQLPFECYICKKSFAQHYEMVQHMAEHDDDEIGDEDADSVLSVAEGEGKPAAKESRRYDFKLRLKGKEKERVSLRVKRRKSAYESLRSRR